jgi:hypothetical protein
MILLLIAAVLLTIAIVYWLSDTPMADTSLRFIYAPVIALILITVPFDLSVAFGLPFRTMRVFLLLTGIVALYTQRKKISIKRAFSNIISVRTGFYSVIVLALIYYLSTMFIPHSGRWGRWDPRAIWTLHALFLYDQQHWMNMFSPDIAWTHADYPLMLSSLTAEIWRAMGSVNALVPCVIAYGIFIAVLLIVSTALRERSKWFLGLLGLLAFVFTAAYAKLAAYQGADTLLSLFILMAIVLLRKNIHSTNLKLIFLAGFFAGFAGWVKNEGIAFLVVFSLGVIWRYRKTPSVLLYYAGGTLLPLLIIVSFKVFFAPANDIVGGQGYATLMKLLDFDRYKLTTRFFISNMWQFYPVLLVLVAMFVVRRFGRLWALELFILIAMLVVYYFTFIITPRELQWHLETASDRLFLQLFPGFVFVLLSLLGEDRVPHINLD